MYVCVCIIRSRADIASQLFVIKGAKWKHEFWEVWSKQIKDFVMILMVTSHQS